MEDEKNIRVYDATEHEKMRRRLDIHVLPPLAFLWLANFIDRANAGNARIAGLEKDLGLKGTQFNTCLAVFYAGYICSELPSNLILKRVGANYWLPTLVIAWGVVTTLTGLVQNFAGFASIRVILGICEGGLLPGMILYLSTLYRRHELQIRVGVFYASASLSGAFGGLLATAILNLDGRAGLEGWRWIFILEGIATCVIGVITSFILPQSLATAKFLTPEERDFAIHRFHADAASTYQTTAAASPAEARDSDEHEKIDSKVDDAERVERANTLDFDPYKIKEPFEWKEVRRGIFDVQTWLTGLSYLGLCMSLYSFSLFLPTIIANLGYSGPHAQLMTVPPYVRIFFQVSAFNKLSRFQQSVSLSFRVIIGQLLSVHAVLTVVVAFLADKYKARGPFMMVLYPICAIGYIISLAAKTNTGRYVGTFFIAAGIYPSAPCILSILPNNHSGHWKRASSTALQLMIANCAGFGATFVYTKDQIPTHYRKGHAIVLSCVVVAFCLITSNVVYCARENRKRAAGERDGNITAWENRSPKLDGQIIGISSLTNLVCTG
ncbi:MFS general substrate transporter [Atractiella rhizophila]|nr:MFS general substrate transporter [Atractiella rhizophila]